MGWNQVRIQGRGGWRGWGARPSNRNLWEPRIDHFIALFNFCLFFVLLHSAHYVFNVSPFFTNQKISSLTLFGKLFIHKVCASEEALVSCILLYLAVWSCFISTDLLNTFWIGLEFWFTKCVTSPTIFDYFSIFHYTWHTSLSGTIKRA